MHQQEAAGEQAGWALQPPRELPKPVESIQKGATSETKAKAKPAAVDAPKRRETPVEEKKEPKPNGGVGGGGKEDKEKKEKVREVGKWAGRT